MIFILRITICFLGIYRNRKVLVRLFLLNILHIPKIPFIFAPLNERFLHTHKIRIYSPIYQPIKQHKEKFQINIHPDILAHSSFYTYLRNLQHIFPSLIPTLKNI